MNEKSQYPESKGAVSNTDLLDRITLLDKQVADLQADQVIGHRPWWKDALTLITLLALVFSIATALFSFTQSNQQRRHDLRTEFREIALRLSEMPREQIDLSSSGKSNSAIRDYYALLQDERLVLLGQASEIASQIANDLSWSEYYLLAKASEDALDYESARSYYQNAIVKAIMPEYKSTALRAKGVMEIDQGMTAIGRKDLEEAIRILDREITSNPQLLSSIELTYFVWFHAEYRRGNCSEFFNAFQKAKTAREISNRSKAANALVSITDYSDLYVSQFAKCPVQK